MDAKISTIILLLCVAFTEATCGTPSPPIPASVCGDSDWVVYSDEKCFKLITKWETKEQAEALCKSQSSTTTTPSLVSIKSQEEQNFLTKYLFEISQVESNVWTGAVRLGEGGFTWKDGSELEYKNWAPESPTQDTKRNCVALLSSVNNRFKNSTKNVQLGENIGKWRDLSCNGGNFVLCEKLQTWSFVQLQQAFLNARKEQNDSLIETKNELSQTQNELSETKNELSATKNELSITKNGLSETKNDLSETKSKLSATENRLNTAQNGLTSLQQNPVPLGFLYTQLGGQPEPTTIWPQVKWEEVSANYAGFFFRVAGGGAAEFGTPQEENAPRLVGVRSFMAYHNYDMELNNIPANNEWFGRIYAGSGYHSNINQIYAHSLKISSGEVRPRNQAIRIWKRIA